MEVTKAGKIPEMITLQEARERTGLSLEYLRAARDKGEIVYIMCGRKTLINYEKLIDHLNGLI